MLMLSPLQFSPAQAGNCDIDPAVRRTVIAFYNSRTEAEPRDTRIHRYLEMPFNHLGYRLRYIDAADKAALAALPAGIAAFVSWFNAPLPAPDTFARAVLAAVADCMPPPPSIVLDHPGTDTPTGPVWASYLDRLGAGQAAAPLQTGVTDAIEYRDSQIVGFETGFLVQPGLPVHLDLSNTGKTHLRIATAKGPGDLVITGPSGAYVHRSAAIAADPRGGDFWIVDPFRLLRSVLGHGVRPIPDVTTRNGRRVFFSTVNASGWLAMMPLRQFGDAPQSVLSVLRDRILATQPDLPVTLGVVTGDFDAELGGPQAAPAHAIARDLLSRPNVQPATSGMSMIRDWAFFRDNKTAHPAEQKRDSLIASTLQRLGGPSARTDPSAPAPMPRKYNGRPFDLSTEIAGAINTAAQMAGPDAPTPLFVPGGDARPFAAALATAREKGALAMGGGGGLCIATAPSISNLWPLSAPVGGERQIYHALSDDSAYTDAGSRPHRFLALADTLACTETPRRLKPFQLSYAVSSVQDYATRQAILRFLELAREGDFFPLTATEYAASVIGFDSVEFIATGPREWRVTHRDGIDTIRFDDALGLSLDMARSDNVLGAARHDAALYIALNPGASDAHIALTGSDAPSGIVLAGLRPALGTSKTTIRARGESACTITVAASGFAPDRIAWIGAPGTTYGLDIHAADDMLLQDHVTASADGTFLTPAPVAPGQPVDITLSQGCERGPTQ